MLSQLNDLAYKLRLLQDQLGNTENQLDSLEAKLDERVASLDQKSRFQEQKNRDEINNLDAKIKKILRAQETMTQQVESVIQNTSIKSRMEELENGLKS